MTFDHFQPQSHGGTDDTANLVYSCHACNEFKGDYWTEDNNTRLLHPLTDNPNAHIAQEVNGTLRPLTPLGQIYIDRLQLNRSALVDNRLEGQRQLRVESRLGKIENALFDILSKLEERQQ